VALLSTDIKKLIELQQEQIEKIAWDHSHKLEDIKKLVNNETNYRSSQGPSLANALIHKKGIEMNEGIVIITR
jgi:hypothetical protein